MFEKGFREVFGKVCWWVLSEVVEKSVREVFGRVFNEVVRGRFLKSVLGRLLGRGFWCFFVVRLLKRVLGRYWVRLLGEVVGGGFWKGFRQVFGESLWLVLGRLLKRVLGRFLERAFGEVFGEGFRNGF